MCNNLQIKWIINWPIYIENYGLFCVEIAKILAEWLMIKFMKIDHLSCSMVLSLVIDINNHAFIIDTYVLKRFGFACAVCLF